MPVLNEYKANSQPVLWLNLLRVFGVFSVIAIHVAYPFTADFSHFRESSWIISNIWESFFRSGVAIFLMLSGALLFKKTNRPWVFLRKRVLRVISPFLIWSVVYLCVTPDSQFTSLGDLALLIITGVTPHLWYIKTLLLLYLVVTVVAKRVLSLSSIQFIIMLIVIEFLVLASLVYRESTWVNEIRNFLACFELLLVGFFLSRSTISINRRKWLGVLLFLLGAVCAFLSTYFYSAYTATYKDFFYSVLSPFILLKAVGTFLFFSSIEKVKYEFPMVNKLTVTSFGIYLIHPLVLLYIIRPLFVSLGVGLSAISIPMTAISCFLFSFGFLYIVSKTKLARYFM